MRTIRSRMLVTILGVIALCWIALIPITQYQTRGQISSMMDQRAEYMADTLLVILEGEVKEGGTQGLALKQAGSLEPHHYDSETPFPFQLWVEDELRAHTISTPDFAPPSTTTLRWQSLEMDGENWRVLTSHKRIESHTGETTANAFAVVGIRVNELNALVDSLVWRSSWPLFVTLPILALAVFFGIGIAMRPLREIAQQVGSQSPSKLKPFEIEKIPGEVSSLVNALNHLFGEVQRAFANEQRFTADAAHELRTPLSALRAQAQVAQSTDNDASRGKALQQIVTSVDRLAHLVSQLLTLARLDPQTELVGEPSDLIDITTETMADLGTVAIDKNVELDLQTEGHPIVYGDQTLISVLIHNLLDNAIKYTPKGGDVTVTISSNDDQIEFTVSDSGPGIPEDQKQNVLRRFYRLNNSDEFGTGLGLSIAARIASLHGASIDFRDGADGGTVAVVTFKSGSIAPFGTT